MTRGESAWEKGIPPLPDPRRYGADGASHRLLELNDERALRGELRDALAGSRDADIAAALRAAPTREAYLHLWRAVCDVAHRIGGDADETPVVVRVFALPLVIVTGSRRPAQLPGVVPDIAAVTALFERHGALGKTRNFGLGNALCSFETLAAIQPGEIFAWTGAAGGAPRELAPGTIAIDEPGEQVHLRFLAGAAIAPAAEPSFVETASNIGAWGMALTRTLAAQLNQTDVEALPLPRPPLDLMRAAHAGRVAQLETAFNLFVSNAVRRFRAAAGDPVAVISAHDDGEIRVALSSPFDDTVVDGFRWPLHPLDDIGRIAGSFTDLLEECRVAAVHCASAVLPALDPRGQVRFLSAREGERAQAVAGRH